MDVAYTNSINMSNNKHPFIFFFSWYHVSRSLAQLILKAIDPTQWKFFIGCQNKSESARSEWFNNLAL